MVFDDDWDFSPIWHRPRFSEKEMPAAPVEDNIHKQLIRVASGQDITSATDLLGQGANPNFIDEAGFTPLMMATIPTMIATLIEAGSNPNYQHADSGNTALMYRIHGDQSECVRELLRLGADPNLGNGSKSTPLIRASRLGHATIARMLLDEGADVTSQNLAGNTALSAAKRKENAAIVGMLTPTG